jgi:prephenate dehydrogenase
MEAPAAPAAVRDEIAALVRRGRAGRSRLPGRHGEAPRATATVAVVVRDRPGQLHGLLGVLAAADVNVEDLRIDHAVGQPTGVVEVVVSPESAARAIAALHTAGWSAQDVTPGDA